MSFGSKVRTRGGSPRRVPCFLRGLTPRFKERKMSGLGFKGLEVSGKGSKGRKMSNFGLKGRKMSGWGVREPDLLGEFLGFLSGLAPLNRHLHRVLVLVRRRPHQRCEHLRTGREFSDPSLRASNTSPPRRRTAPYQQRCHNPRRRGHPGGSYIALRSRPQRPPRPRQPPR